MADPKTNSPELTTDERLSTIMGHVGAMQLDVTKALQLAASSEVKLDQLAAAVTAVTGQLATVLQVVEEARPLLESGPAKFLRGVRRQPSATG